MFELERGGASFLVRVDRGVASPSREPRGAGEAEERAARPVRRAADGARAARLAAARARAVPAPPLHRVRQLSYSALALFQRCSYRYYAERVAGLRERRGAGGRAARARRRPRSATRCTGCSSSSTCGVRRRPTSSSFATWYPGVTDEELARIGAFVRSYCESELAAPVAALDGAGPSGRSRSCTTACCCTGGSTCSAARASRALVVDYKTNVLGERTPRRSSSRTTGSSASSTRSRASGPAPTRSRSSRLPRASRRGRLGDVRRAPTARARGRALGGDRAVDAGEFVPTPSEFTCAGCPALDLVCAGPKLRQPPGRLVAAA